MLVVLGVLLAVLTAAGFTVSLIGATSDPGGLAAALLIGGAILGTCAGLPLVGICVDANFRMHVANLVAHLRGRPLPHARHEQVRRARADMMREVRRYEPPESEADNEPR